MIDADPAPASSTPDSDTTAQAARAGHPSAGARAVRRGRADAEGPGRRAPRRRHPGHAAAARAPSRHHPRGEGAPVDRQHQGRRRRCSQRAASRCTRPGAAATSPITGPASSSAIPILDLRPDRCDVHRYVRDLEEVLIRTLGDFGVEAGRLAGLTGRLGRRPRRSPRSAFASRAGSPATASHSTSATDLDYFDLIVPCGITDRGVTSLEALLGREVAVDEVATRVIARVCEVFGREAEERRG